MNSQCPACSTAYTVTPADVGRRIACAKCGVVLVVDAEGLRPDSGSPIPVPEAKSSAPSNLTTSFTARLTGWDRPLILFALGAVLVVAFTILPHIAAGQVDRQNAILGEAALDQAAGIRAMRERGAEDRQLREAEERWQKLREEYTDSVRRAEFAKARSAYWDRYGLLAGAVLLTIGAITLMRDPERSPMLRWAAGVIVTVQLLLAFQTIAPVGCAPLPRSYNPGGNPIAPVDPTR